MPPLPRPPLAWHSSVARRRRRKGARDREPGLPGFAAAAPLAAAAAVAVPSAAALLLLRVGALASRRPASPSASGPSPCAAGAAWARFLGLRRRHSMLPPTAPASTPRGSSSVVTTALAPRCVPPALPPLPAPASARPARSRCQWSRGVSGCLRRRRQTGVRGEWWREVRHWRAVQAARQQVRSGQEAGGQAGCRCAALRSPGAGVVNEHDLHGGSGAGRQLRLYVGVVHVSAARARAGRRGGWHAGRHPAPASRARRAGCSGRQLSAAPCLPGLAGGAPALTHRWFSFSESTGLRHQASGMLPVMPVCATLLRGEGSAATAWLRARQRPQVAAAAHTWHTASRSARVRALAGARPGPAAGQRCLTCRRYWARAGRLAACPSGPGSRPRCTTTAQAARRGAAKRPASPGPPGCCWSAAAPPGTAGKDAGGAVPRADEWACRQGAGGQLSRAQARPAKQWRTPQQRGLLACALAQLSGRLPVRRFCSRPRCCSACAASTPEGRVPCRPERQMSLRQGGAGLRGGRGISLQPPPQAQAGCQGPREAARAHRRERQTPASLPRPTLTGIAAGGSCLRRASWRGWCPWPGRATWTCAAARGSRCPSWAAGRRRHPCRRPRRPGAGRRPG